MHSNERSDSRDPRQCFKQGDLILRKRTTFPTHVNKKLAYKINFSGYKVTKKVASGTYFCENLADGSTIVLPASQMIRWHQDEQSLVELLGRMEKIAYEERAKPRNIKYSLRRTT